MADFVAEFTMTKPNPKAEYWTIYTNGSSAVGVGGVDVILLSPEKDILKYGFSFNFYQKIMKQI